VFYDFEMMFRFILPSWEDSTHDIRVFRDVLGEGDLKSSSGKFYLGDVGYTSEEYILIPYRDIKYHLRE